MAFTSTMVLSYSATYYQIVFLLEIAYYCFVLTRIIVKGREGAFYIALASLILFAAVIIEALALRDLLSVGDVTSYARLRTDHCTLPNFDVITNTNLASKDGAVTNFYTSAYGLFKHG